MFERSVSAFHRLVCIPTTQKESRASKGLRRSIVSSFYISSICFASIFVIYIIKHADIENLAFVLSVSNNG